MLSKLNAILFNSSDFKNDTSKRHFRNLLGDVGDLLHKPKKPIKIKTNRKKVKVGGKKKTEPYSICRVDRPGMKMFEMVEATNTPDKW